MNKKYYSRLSRQGHKKYKMYKGRGLLSKVRAGARKVIDFTKANILPVLKNAIKENREEIREATNRVLQRGLTNVAQKQQSRIDRVYARADPYASDVISKDDLMDLISRKIASVDVGPALNKIGSGRKLKMGHGYKYL